MWRGKQCESMEDVEEDGLECVLGHEANLNGECGGGLTFGAQEKTPLRKLQ